MMFDREENEIFLVDEPNGHVLVLGRSGSGKTYFCCRKIEEDFDKGRRIFIIDFSGSYSDSEMQKNKFAYWDQTEIWNPFEQDICWDFRGSNMEKVVADALIDTLGIGSYYQKKILMEAINNLVKQQGAITIYRLINEVERISKVSKSEDETKNAFHILNRLYPYENITMSWIETKTICEEKERKIVVLELSQYSCIVRKFLLEFSARLLWEEARATKSRADIVLFDEFQYMDLRGGSAIDSLLREGRKFGISAYLSSQFLGRKGEEARETLMQAGNCMFFSPTEVETKSIASWIAPNAKREWESILRELCRGEAVLRGSYRIRYGNNICTTPIICKVRRR